MQECARVCQSIPEYARQRRANNSVFEYYSNNIRIPKYSYSYSVDFFRPNNIHIRVIFSKQIIFLFVIECFFKQTHKVYFFTGPPSKILSVEGGKIPTNKVKVDLSKYEM